MPFQRTEYAGPGDDFGHLELTTIALIPLAILLVLLHLACKAEDIVRLHRLSKHPHQSHLPAIKDYSHSA